MTVTIKPAFLSHASFITANMRAEDKAEIYCQLPDGFKSYEVAAMLLRAEDAFIAYLDDAPVLLFGANPLNVVTLEAWAMGTDKTHRVLFEATRYIFAEFIPRVVEAGYQTVECRSHVEHRKAHRWLESTGAVASGEPFVYGKNGEKFVLYRWTRDSIPVAEKRYKVTACRSLKLSKP